MLVWSSSPVSLLAISGWFVGNADNSFFPCSCVLDAEVVVFFSFLRCVTSTKSFRLHTLSDSLSNLTILILVQNVISTWHTWARKQWNKLRTCKKFEMLAMGHGSFFMCHLHPANWLKKNGCISEKLQMQVERSSHEFEIQMEKGTPKRRLNENDDNHHRNLGKNLNFKRKPCQTVSEKRTMSRKSTEF